MALPDLHLLATETQNAAAGLSAVLSRFTTALGSSNQLWGAWRQERDALYAQQAQLEEQLKCAAQQAAADAEKQQAELQQRDDRVKELEAEACQLTSALERLHAEAAVDREAAAVQLQQQLQQQLEQQRHALQEQHQRELAVALANQAAHEQQKQQQQQQHVSLQAREAELESQWRELASQRQQLAAERGDLERQRAALLQLQQQQQQGLGTGTRLGQEAVQVHRQAAQHQAAAGDREAQSAPGLDHCAASAGSPLHGSAAAAVGPIVQWRAAEAAAGTAARAGAGEGPGVEAAEEEPGTVGTQASDATLPPSQPNRHVVMVPETLITGPMGMMDMEVGCWWPGAAADGGCMGQVQGAAGDVAQPDRLHLPAPLPPAAGLGTGQETTGRASCGAAAAVAQKEQQMCLEAAAAARHDGDSSGVGRPAGAVGACAGGGGADDGGGGQAGPAAGPGLAAGSPAGTGPAHDEAAWAARREQLVQEYSAQMAAAWQENEALRKDLENAMAYRKRSRIEREALIREVRALTEQLRKAQAEAAEATAAAATAAATAALPVARSPPRTCVARVLVSVATSPPPSQPDPHGPHAAAAAELAAALEAAAASRDKYRERYRREKGMRRHWQNAYMGLLAEVKGPEAAAAEAAAAAAAEAGHVAEVKRPGAAAAEDATAAAAAAEAGHVAEVKRPGAAAMEAAAVATAAAAVAAAVEAGHSAEGAGVGPGLQGQVVQQRQRQQQRQQRVEVTEHVEEAAGGASSGVQQQHRARTARGGAERQADAATVEGFEEAGDGEGAQQPSGGGGCRRRRSRGEPASGHWRRDGERAPWEPAGDAGEQRLADGAGGVGDGGDVGEEQDVDLTQAPHEEERHAGQMGGAGEQQDRGQRMEEWRRGPEGWRREHQGEQSGRGQAMEGPGAGVGYVDERGEGDGEDSGQAAAVMGQQTQPRAVQRPGPDLIRTGWAQGAGQGVTGRQDEGTGGEGWRPGLADSVHARGGGDHGAEAGARGGRGGSRHVREQSPAAQDVEGGAGGMGWPEGAEAGGGESQPGEGDGGAVQGANAKWFSKRGRSRDPFEWSGDEAGAAARGGNGTGRPGTGGVSGRGGAMGAGAGAGAGGPLGRRYQQQTLPFLPKPGRGAQQGPEAGGQGAEAGRRSGRRYSGQPWSQQQQQPQQFQEQLQHGAGNGRWADPNDGDGYGEAEQHQHDQQHHQQRHRQQQQQGEREGWVPQAGGNHCDDDDVEWVEVHERPSKTPRSAERYGDAPAAAAAAAVGRAGTPGYEAAGRAAAHSGRRGAGVSRVREPSPQPAAGGLRSVSSDVGAQGRGDRGARVRYPEAAEEAEVDTQAEGDGLTPGPRFNLFGASRQQQPPVHSRNAGGSRGSAAAADAGADMPPPPQQHQRDLHAHNNTAQLAADRRGRPPPAAAASPLLSGPRAGYEQPRDVSGPRRLPSGTTGRLGATGPGAALNSAVGPGAGGPSAFAAAAGSTAGPTGAAGAGDLPPGPGPGPGPGYKYTAVVRKRAEREVLKAVECAGCRAFYDAILSWGGQPPADLVPTCNHARPQLQQQDHQQQQQGMVPAQPQPQDLADQLRQAGGRHRFKYAPPATPDGFWDIGFGDDG